jgi:transcriptional regulator of acetoin/glycerol metabolism
VNPAIRDDAVSLREAASACLLSALKQNNWNRLKTAKQLGIHKSTLYRKIKSLGLSVPK